MIDLSLRVLRGSDSRDGWEELKTTTMVNILSLGLSLVDEDVDWTGAEGLKSKTVPVAKEREPVVNREKNGPEGGIVVDERKVLFLNDGGGREGGEEEAVPGSALLRPPMSWKRNNLA